MQKKKKKKLDTELKTTGRSKGGTGEYGLACLTQVMIESQDRRLGWPMVGSGMGNEMF